MGIENRPFVGTWRLNRQQVVQHTPDCLVYLNGDLSLPGCARCNSKINIQEFVTEVSVDAGTDPGATSASFTLSVPVHHHESFARDAQFILRPGLEVHIYQRGYFPVEGMYYQTDADTMPAYPYYHVFHGVVTQVGGAYSAGVQTFSVQCGSMLHFWQFQQVSTNASIFGQRPDNSGNKISSVGHNYTGQHPYEIIWHIHNDFISAAAGVGFALSSQTNIAAMFGDKTLFSLAAKYWEERFKTSTIRLRMHGATGQLFNAAQAAFLGRASSKELLKLTRSRFNQSNTGSKSNPAVWSDARIRGSWTPDTLDALLYLDKASTSSKPVDLNVVEMQAFITDIGQFGQFNEFESTYESKLDMVNKVCDVTGFEFYQDVDGDFVFKPPFYNLDTSGSRTYCIEDIDIINISFEEKEPEVTYMTAKGGAVKNVTGVGVENEYGVRGQYVDYRLVAQYGWRPGEFETSYFNDKDAMQHAAANKLDIMNAPSKSASVTIPLRPEIRPGYPVYIRYLDCYYYCTSMSHSYMAGGQCTTTLQLIAKRAKFFAPGDVDKPNGGINAIHLENPAMPPRPLQVADNRGYPTLMGFPNVVMGLDPKKVDPRILLLGGGVFDVSIPTMIPGIILMALDMNVIRFADGADQGTLFEMQTGESTVQKFKYDLDQDLLPPGTHPQTYSDQNAFADLAAGVDAYKEQLEDLANTKKVQKKALRKASNAVVKASADYKKIANIEANKTKRVTARAEIKKAEKKVAVVKNILDQCDIAFEAKLSNIEDTEPVKMLYSIVQNMMSIKDGSRKDINSTNFILGVLADKKATRTNGSLPGSYRYYSSSHPKPQHQGMGSLTINVTDEDKSHTIVEEPLENGQIEGEGFLPDGSQTPLNKAVDSKFGKISVTKGIKVLTGHPNKKGGIVVPTSEIRELMFSPVEYNMTSVKTTTINKSNPGALGSKFFANLTSSAVVVANAATKRMTSEDAFSAWLQTLNSNLRDAAAGASLTLPIPGDISMPSVKLKSESIKPSDSPQDFKLSDSPQDVFGASETRAFAGSESMTVDQFWKAVAKSLGKSVQSSVNTWVKTWRQAALKEELEAQQSLGVISQFFSTLANVYGPVGITKIQRTSGNKNKNISVSSPVFPVSDARGYEVVGSYRYGRGVDIDENGVFSQLVLDGPLESLDIASVDIFVNGLMRNKATVEYAQTQALLQSLSKARPDDEALASIRQNVSKVGDEASKTQMLTDGLRNWYTTSVKDGVAKTKIQLTNAAYSLADLTPESLRVCNCKMAEANIILESAQDREFIPVIEGFMELQQDDPVTATNAKATAAAGQNWILHQKALRGQVLDRDPGDLVEFVSNLNETLEAADRATQQKTEEFESFVEEEAREASENVDDAFGGDGEV